MQGVHSYVYHLYYVAQGAVMALLAYFQLSFPTSNLLLHDRKFSCQQLRWYCYVTHSIILHVVVYASCFGRWWVCSSLHWYTVVFIICSGAGGRSW